MWCNQRLYRLRSQDGLTYKAQSGDKHGLESSSIPDARRWINAVAIFRGKKKNYVKKQKNFNPKKAPIVQ